uniref:IST1-like protein n=1 Tax=Davidia involucrata TaxID=16924 RepID=A0A5B7BPB7_DAVIN
MSMLDSFFNKGFKAAKCKTLLKLSIPRIKLLRNRREIQIKQMRRDIAKLLETGQEATARIRVEHIIREEKIMAAQEIIELFCELIAVRLPIIEAQRECPLDLKEAISSLCFAAPRCADLSELLQVQMLFAAKYGKEFVLAATDLMPECGVNRQLIELLSVRAPAPDVKLKLLKEIAEEHELDWDPAASETELLKPHEDLLNGPTQFVSGSKLPLPKEKHDESLYSASEQAPNEESDSDTGFDPTDFPEAPKASVQPSAGIISPVGMLPFPGSPLPEVNHESAKKSGTNENLSHEPHLEPEEVLQEKSVTNKSEVSNTSVGPMEDKQFVPFISPPSLSSASFSSRQIDPRLPPSLSRARSEVNVDLQDVLAAAQAAADSAERAAAAARSAASLAQVRISELVKKKSDEIADSGSENPFHADTCQPAMTDSPHLDHQNSGDSDGVSNSPILHQEPENYRGQHSSNLPSYDDPEVEFDSPLSNDHVLGHDSAYHQPQRLPSMDEETCFSYPNLFKSQDSNLGSGVHSFTDNSRSTHEL